MLRFSQLFNFLFFLWAEIGSVLDPDGRPKPNAGDSRKRSTAWSSSLIASGKRR